MSDNKNTTEQIMCGTGNQFHENGISVRVCLDDIPAEHRKEWNGKVWLHLTLSKLKNPKAKQTHSLRVDTYKPKGG